MSKMLDRARAAHENANDKLTHAILIVRDEFPEAREVLMALYWESTRRLDTYLKIKAQIHSPRLEVAWDEYYRTKEALVEARDADKAAKLERATRRQSAQVQAPLQGVSGRATRVGRDKIKLTLDDGTETQFFARKSGGHKYNYVGLHQSIETGRRYATVSRTREGAAKGVRFALATNIGVFKIE